MQDEFFQIDGVAEEGECRRSHRVWTMQTEFVNGVYCEGAEERKWSRIDFRKPLNFRPVIVSEIEGPDLNGVGRE